MHERGAGGGADRVFWGLHDHLASSADIQADAFFFWHRSDQSKIGAREFCLGSTKQPGYRRLWNMRRRILTELQDRSRPTLVASHFAFYAAALLPKLSRLDHVVHFHGPWAAETAVERRRQINVAMKRMIERAVYSSAKAFIVLSHAFKEILVNEYRIVPERVHVIPGAVDLERFSPGDRDEARVRLGWPRHAKIVFCVRRLVRRMGLETLLEAFAAVASKHPGSILIIGGTGPLRNELEAQVRSRKLSDQVRFTEFIPDAELSFSYRAADLSIVPSQSLEGFGLTALESLACGTPVLVTPVGGLPEAVRGLSRQLVLADRSAVTLAKSLDEFLRDTLSLPSAEKCRKYVEADFSWPKIAQKVSELYWQVAQESMWKKAGGNPR
jgi:glycogen synthase